MPLPGYSHGLGWGGSLISRLNVPSSSLSWTLGECRSHGLSDWGVVSPCWLLSRDHHQFLAFGGISNMAACFVKVCKLRRPERGQCRQEGSHSLLEPKLGRDTLSLGQYSLLEKGGSGCSSQSMGGHSRVRIPGSHIRSWLHQSPGWKYLNPGFKPRQCGFSQCNTISLKKGQGTDLRPRGEGKAITHPLSSPRCMDRVRGIENWKVPTPPKQPCGLSRTHSPFEPCGLARGYPFWFWRNVNTHQLVQGIFSSFLPASTSCLWLQWEKGLCRPSSGWPGPSPSWPLGWFTVCQLGNRSRLGGG